MNYYILSDEESFWKNKLNELISDYGKAWKRIGEAAGGNCDWHDNFEFDDAQRVFSIIGEKLRLVQSIISWSQIIKEINDGIVVTIGKRVTLSVHWWKEQSYTIWWYNTPVESRISYSAPVIHAILWKTEGDVIEIIIHWKKQEIEILEVSVGVNLLDLK